MTDLTENKPTHRLNVTYSANGEVSGTIKIDGEDRQHGFYFGRGDTVVRLENGYSIMLNRKIGSIEVRRPLLPSVTAGVA